MPLDHLQNKRTGRPRGSKSSSPLKRDLLWACRNLGKDLEPPTDGARFWIAMARAEPAKFVAAVAELDAVNTRSGNEPQDGNPVAHAGQQLKTVFLTEKDVLKTLRSYRAGMPDDIRLAGFALTRGGAYFTIRSEAFRPLAEGEQIPEQMSKYGRAP